MDPSRESSYEGGGVSKKKNIIEGQNQDVA